MRTKAKRLLLGATLLLLLLAFLGTGCTKYASQQDLQTLQEQKQAAQSAEQKVGDLKKDKGDLERQLAKKNAELQAAQDEKAKTGERLQQREAQQAAEEGGE